MTRKKRTKFHKKVENEVAVTRSELESVSRKLARSAAALADLRRRIAELERRANGK